MNLKKLTALFLIALLLISLPVSAETLRPDAAITVPADAVLFVGEKSKTHFVRFREHAPVLSEANDDNKTYYFDLADDQTYNYRISGENYVTNGGTFTKTPDFSLTVTKEMLMPPGKSKTTVDRDMQSNRGYNTADIYLNINARGHLSLKPGETFQIVSLRNWEAVNSTTANYFIEPDFHFSAIDENGNPSDVVSVTPQGLLTAEKEGSAIILVTYDSMLLHYREEAEFFGAIHPENTGVFVVTVEENSADFDTGMTIHPGKNSPTLKLSGDSPDAEHDCIYFTGESGVFRFTPPDESITVSVANPTVTSHLSFAGFRALSKEADGSYAVPLVEGRNIVRLSKNGKNVYQILTAKSVNITINDGAPVRPGDALSIRFDTLFHPANKLAGVYNMNAIALYTEVSHYEGQYAGAASAQYTFQSRADAQTISSILQEKNVWGAIQYEKSADLVVPADYAFDTFKLSGGAIYVSGWGDAYGNHRAITYEGGKGENFNADAKLSFLGMLPDIEIPITADSELVSLTVNADAVKKTYFIGESFDATGLIVTAAYGDGTQESVSQFTVSPSVLTADTKKVTVSYRDKTAEIPVSVSAPRAIALKIVTPPEKTTYKTGESFSPDGMQVFVVYENGTEKETTAYTYAPVQALSVSDTKITLTLATENDGIPITVTLPITVTKNGNTGSTSLSDSISVFFTLLGDTQHGTPSAASGTHTKSKDNLTSWIAKTKISVKKGSTIMEVIEKALQLSDIPFEKNGDYIRSVRGLSEFDNGELSGWMYLLNGKYSSKGVSVQTVKAGDSIILHYTDDYTAEKNELSSQGNGNASLPIVFPKNPAPSSAPSSPVQGENTLLPIKRVFSENTYQDVSSQDWFFDAVKFTYENELMQGDAVMFSPHLPLTRAMLLTVLWRMAGAPEQAGTLGFSDVKEDAWYADATLWARENGITTGKSQTQFAPSEPVTREEAATFFYRYALKNGQVSSSAAPALTQFQDAHAVSSYAQKALSWATDCGLIKGTSENLLSPALHATRAEAAVLLMRFCKEIAE